MVRAVVTLVILPLLAGCVLQSEKPLITDANAVLAFGDKPVNLHSFQWQDGGWQATVPPVITVLPEGKHYVVPNMDDGADQTKAAQYYFMALGQGQLLIEVVTKGEVDYAAASWDGTEMLVAAFDCGAMQDRPGVAALVTFDGDNCSLKPDALDAALVFDTLYPDLPAPSLRLTR